MPLRYERSITRAMLRAEPDTLFVFGDNFLRTGLGGQAKEMRGEPNAVGVPTKRAPNMREGSFLADHDWGDFLNEASRPMHRLRTHAETGGTIVWPADGIGTGLADLPTRAPRIWAALERARLRLEAIAAEAAPGIEAAPADTMRSSVAGGESPSDAVGAP